MLNEMINANCFDIFPKIENNSIDMILCDLPYGTTKNKWDSNLPLELLWEEYNRIIKDNGAIVLTAQTPFDKILGYSNIKNLKYEWIWDKESTTGFLNANKMPLKRHENILVFYKKLPTYNPIKTIGDKSHSKGKMQTKVNNNYGKFTVIDNTEKQGNMKFPTTILNFKKPHPSKALHPTQKPVELFEYLIKTYTNENEVVLDNCSGSGTTAIACLNTNRNYICIEKEKKYYDISIDRIEIHTRNNKFNEWF